MLRSEIRNIAEVITTAELKEMVLNAYSKVDDWTVPSKGNKSMSLGTIFNILTSGEITDKTNFIVKINLIREFSLYLPEKYKIPKKVKVKVDNIVHQEPKPLNASYYEF